MSRIAQESAAEWFGTVQPLLADFIAQLSEIFSSIRREQARYQLAGRVALAFAEKAITDADEESFTPDVIKRNCRVATLYARAMFPIPEDPAWPQPEEHAP